MRAKGSLFLTGLAIWLMAVGCGTEGENIPPSTGGSPTANGGSGNIDASVPIGGSSVNETGGTGPADTGGNPPNSTGGRATGGRFGTGGSGGRDCASCHGGGLDAGLALRERPTVRIRVSSNYARQTNKPAG